MISQNASTLRALLYFAIGFLTPLAAAEAMTWREAVGALVAGLVALRAYVDVSVTRVEPAKTGTAGT